jgi:indolepyruvate ferredoxin oxidoreductase beta subunit
MTTKKIVIMAVGGQGNLLISKILGEAAIQAGIPVQISEVHGMAQRGGVVETDVLLGDISSSTISNGEADILVSFEPLEAVRALSKCNKDSLVITNTAPVLPFTVTSGSAEYPDIEKSMTLVKQKVKDLVTIDAAALAEKAGAAVALNMVMLGVLAQRGQLPLTDEVIKETINTKVKKAFREINIRAFNLGYETASGVV